MQVFMLTFALCRKMAHVRDSYMIHSKLLISVYLSAVAGGHVGCLKLLIVP